MAQATTDESRKLVEKYFAAMTTYRTEQSKESLAQVLAFFSEDVDWDIAGDREHVPWIGRRRNHSEIAEFYEKDFKLLSIQDFQVSATLAEGERVVVLGKSTAIAVPTGKTFETDIAFDFTVRGGQIVRYRVYEDSYAISQAMKP